MKKIIAISLIISIMNLVGCYYQENMRPSNYDFNDHSDIQITTSDTSYKLSGDDYYFVNDTLFATLMTNIDQQTTLKTNVEIPLIDIKNVEIERTDAFASIATALGVITAVLALAIAIGLSESGWL